MLLTINKKNDIIIDRVILGGACYGKNYTRYTKTN